MTEDSSLISALDQPMPLPAEAKEQMFQKIDETFEQAVAAKDPLILFNSGITLIQLGSLAGLGLAKAAHLLSTNWEVFEMQDTFFDIAFEMWGKTRTYLERLISIWDKYREDQMPEALMDRPIKDQQAIAKMLDQGYEPTPDQWMKIEDAPDNSTLLREIRGIKGTEPRSSGKTFMLKRSGDVVVYVKGLPLHIGWLNVHEEQEEVKKAIEAIVSRVGMTKE